MLYLDTSFLNNYNPFGYKSRNIRSFQSKDIQEKVDLNMVRYHYTSAEALMHILSTAKGDTGTVRFTDSRYMNDRSEHMFFIKLLLSYLKKNNDEYPFCQKVVDELLLKKHNEEDYSSLTVLELEEIELDNFIYTNSRYFLFCLSKDSDSLHMWNYYIRNSNYQGYNIGIRIYDFLKSFDNESYSDKTSPIRFFCGDVLYSQKKQEEEIKNICNIIENLANSENKQSLKLEWGMAYLWAYIESYGLFFKDKCFSDEKEYRIVIQFEEILAGSDIFTFFNNSDITNIDFSFFERNGILVPCLNVPIAKNAVKKITMAPMLESKIASDGIKEYLTINKYKNVEVIQSSIPIRY